MTFDAYAIEESSGDLVGFACEFCAPDGAEPFAMGVGETDSPTHCDCGRPLEHSLTECGVDYVIEAIGEALDAPDSEWTDPAALARGPDYYKGSPRFAVVNDWAEDLANYSLSDEQQMILDRFRDRYSGAETAAEHLRAIARLVRLLTHGQERMGRNPYGHEEVMEGLRLLGAASGVKDPYSVKPEKFIEAERT